MKTIPLTERILALVLLLQHRASFLRARGVWMQAPIDWFSETKKFYFSLGRDKLRETGFSPCDGDFKTLIDFQVTPEILRCTYGDMPDLFKIDAPMAS